MKKRIMLAAAAVMTLSLLLAACGLFAAPASAAPEVDFDRSDYFITVLTGPTSGIYFPIGGGFFQVAHAAGYDASATATGASVANINALLARNGEIAISMVDSAVQAVEAIHAFYGQPPAADLRSVMGLWPNVVQIVTTAGSGIETFEDVRGRRIGVGPPGSGVELNARMIFAAHGMTYDDATVDFLSYGESIDQMRNGLVDAAFVTSGLGNATILELGIDHEIIFIPVDGEARQNLINDYPFYIEFVIPADVYNTAESTETVGLLNIMLTHVDVPDHVIYDLMELFLSEEGLTTIHATHSQALQHIRLENGLRGITDISVPMHEGAIRFFQNRGMM